MAGKRKVYDEAMAMAASFSWDQNWPNAVKAYRAALDEVPDDGPALTGLGVAYLELSQFESAIRALQRALKADPKNFEAMAKIGQALEQLGRTSDAAKTYVYAGNLYARGGQMDEAIENWHKAIQLEPDQTQARNNLAQAYIHQRKHDQAIGELIALAAIFQKQGDEAKAAQHVQGALHLDPQNRYARAANGALENGIPIDSIQQDMSRLAAAEAELAGQHEYPLPASEQEDELDLFADIDLLGEAEPEEEVGNPRQRTKDLALEELAGILFEDESFFGGQLAVEKSEIDRLVGQAIDYQTRGQMAEAIRTYEEIIEAGYKRAAPYFILADMYLDSADYERAINHFNQAKGDPGYALGVNFALGECYKHQDNANQALRYFVEVLKAIDLENANRESTGELEQLYTDLIDSYINEGNEARTMRFVDSLINFLSSKDWKKRVTEARRRLGIDNGASVSAWIEFLETNNAAVILTAMSDTAEYMRQNMFMTATEACFWAIQQEPYYLPLHLRLAEIYMKQERIEEGINKFLAVAEVYEIRENIGQVISIYERVLKVAPMDVTVRSKLIDLHTRRNDVDAALEQYKVLADAYYQLAQVRKSLEKYKEALKLAPKSSRPKSWQAELLYRLGDIYTQRVNWPEATRVYEQLVRLSPQDDRALLQLVDLYFKQNDTSKAAAVLNVLVSLYRRQQKQTRLLQVLQDLIDLRPQEMILRQHLAAFYAESGMMKQALEAYHTLAEMQLDAGLRDDAARTIETILKIGPDDPSGYKRLLAQIRGGI